MSQADHRPWPGPKPQNLDQRRWTVVRAKMTVRDYRELKRVADDLTEQEGRRIYMSELIRRAARALCRAHSDGRDVLASNRPDALCLTIIDDDGAVAAKN